MSLAPCIFPTGEKQKSLFFANESKHAVNQLAQQEVSVFAISSRWFNTWTRYIDTNDKSGKTVGSPPGPIDNSDINYTHNHSRVAHQCLPPDLEQGVTHEWITQKQWELLHGWYGGGPEFGRQILVAQNAMPYVSTIACRDLIALEIRTVTGNHGMNLTFDNCVQLRYFHKKATLRLVAASLAETSQVRLWTRFESICHWYADNPDNNARLNFTEIPHDCLDKTLDTLNCGSKPNTLEIATEYETKQQTSQIQSAMTFKNINGPHTGQIIDCKDKSHMEWTEAVIVGKCSPSKHRVLFPNGTIGYQNKYNHVNIRFIGKQSSQVFIFACVVFSYMYWAKNNSNIHHY